VYQEPVASYQLWILSVYQEPKYPFTIGVSGTVTSVYQEPNHPSYPLFMGLSETVTRARVFNYINL